MSEETLAGTLRATGEGLVLDLGDKQRKVERRRLAADLQGVPDRELDGLDVLATYRKNQIKDVRRAGAPAAQRPARPVSLPTDRFLNPYAFVPTPARSIRGPLGDAPPAGHDRLREGRWTGRIGVVLTTRTPLLLLDTAGAQEDRNGHKTYPVLRDREGAPLLRPTAVKGMLRSACEAVTDSRYGVFTGHDDRYGYRMPTSVSQHMVPARVDGSGKHLTLLPGDTPVGGQTRPNPVLHAAWLPRSPDPGTSATLDPRYVGGATIREGDEVDALVELVQHEDRRGQPNFQLWKVHSVVPVGGTLPASGLRRIRGWAHITNQNINRKHDERIFFAGAVGTHRTLLTDELREQWAAMVRDYRAAHRHKDIHEHGPHVMPWTYL